MIEFPDLAYTRCRYLLFFIIILYSFSAFAQQEESTASDTLLLSEVVVAGAKATTTYSALSRTVAVITREQFSLEPISNLNDLLAKISSVDIRKRGAHGVQADLMVRGGSFDQVLILLNGVNITDPQTGHHNLNIPIDIESVERIEVLQGPGARIYGPGTYSGAVNIITSSDRKEEISVAAAVGEYGLLKSSATARLGHKNIDFFVATSSAQSEGYTANTDFRSHNLFLQSVANSQLGKFHFQAGYHTKAFGAQGFYSQKYPEQFENISSLLASVGFVGRVKGLTFEPIVYMRKHTDRFELFRRESPAWYLGHNYHSTRVTGSRFQLSNLSEKFGKTIVGAEVKYEQIVSNNLGVQLGSPIPVKGYDNAFYTHGGDRLIASTFADHTLYFSGFMVSIGGLYSYNQSFGANWNYGLDASVPLIQAVRLYASVSSAIRFPTFTDLYYHGPTNRGNENLKAEKMQNYELGLKYKKNTLSVSTAVFRREGSDVIDWVMSDADTLYTTMNHAQVNTMGVEFDMRWNTVNMLPFIHGVSCNFTYLNSDNNQQDIMSYYALNYLKWKSTATLSHPIYKGVSVSWTAGLYNRVGSYLEYPSNQLVPYATYSLLNIRLYWQNKRILTFIDVDNALNKEYIDFGGIEQPGRWVSMGLRYKFSLEP